MATSNLAILTCSLGKKSVAPPASRDIGEKDGKELFYLGPDGSMMSVPVKLAPSLETGIPQVLFPTRIRVSPTADQFAVTGDGKRFLLMESTDTEVKPLTVVLN